MLKYKLKKNKGITLIALVVTIIVLLILAGISISMLTGQNGILNRAQEAKEKTQVANEKEAIGLATMDALTEGKGTITKEILTKTMKSYLGKNDIELTGNGPWQYVGSDGAYTIGASGKVSQGWVYVYDENQTVKEAPIAVTNGKITLNIGDYINYDPGTEASYTSEIGIEQTSTYTTNGPDWSGKIRNLNGYKASDYQVKLDDTSNNDKNQGNGYGIQNYSSNQANNIKWQVIGADEETGDLLIFANNKISDLKLRGITGYINGVNELNKACNVYGHGNGATGGRSLTLDDTNKLLGIDNTRTNEKWTFSWKKDSLNKKAPYVESTTKIKDYLYFSHLMIDDNKTGIFNYYDTATKKWVTNTKDLNNVNDDEIITTLIRDYSGYTSLDSKYETTKAYNVIFKANGLDVTSETQYWIGSSYSDVTYHVGARVNYAGWGMYFINKPSYVDGRSMYYSFGGILDHSYGIRPIVSLGYNIQLEKDSASTETTYNIK
mgnify:CR=1 FL=1